MIVSLIAAVDEKGGIGRENKIPWHLSSDLRRFKKITMGHYLIAGRKTSESIDGPLPGRKMIIVTRQPNYSATGYIIVNSLIAALQLASDQQETEVFIIGGGEIFSQAIKFADKIYLTRVHTNISADVFFPKMNNDQWETITSEKVLQDEKDDFPSDFIILSRVD